MSGQRENGAAKNEPIILRTERLTLRLADPSNEEDVKLLLRFYGLDGVLVNRPGFTTSAMAYTTPEAIQRKHRAHGVIPELCTRSQPPYGEVFLSFLPPTDENDECECPEGKLIGGTAMVFRRELPCPDIGYALFARYEGKGFAAEAGRRVLQFWRDEVGLKEIGAFMGESNRQSVKVAERLGLVKGGTLLVRTTGKEDEEPLETLAMVLPGMTWKEYGDDGNRVTAWLPFGKETSP